MSQPTKMVVINASPKGEYSLTLQYARYMMMHESDIVWDVLDVGEELTDNAYDIPWFQASLDRLDACDAVLWATPVYTMLVPYQLLRFLELIKQAGRASVFAGKYATSIMSCFHYYDHLAQHWLQAICEDLGMHFMEGL
ncbi:MAG: NAD(P)H-dependent oxidoreductase, partial [Sphaerochaeta sp.]|nr:NAD(P)H-dependent oxidoreductase [Sphaerochaeta sp.]